MRPAGLEPATCWLEASRSIQLSYGRSRLSKLATTGQARCAITDRLTDITGVHMLPVVPLFILLSGAHASAVAPTPGELVVRRAYKMYGGQWFKNAQFVQRRTLPLERRVETWYVSLQPPGLARVDVAPGATGRAVVYRNDSSYSFGKGQLRARVVDVQPLAVLLHDLHSSPPESTIAMLKKFNFDLTKTHERMWQGQRVIVVGARYDEAGPNQFWLEKKRMVLVRLIEQNGADPARPLDAQIGEYEKAGKGWLEHSVRIFLGGQLTTIDDYSSVAVDGTLEPGLFEPLPYHLPRWVRGANDIFGGVPNIALPGGH